MHSDILSMIDADIDSMPRPAAHFDTKAARRLSRSAPTVGSETKPDRDDVLLAIGILLGGCKIDRRSKSSIRMRLHYEVSLNILQNCMSIGLIDLNKQVIANVTKKRIKTLVSRLPKRIRKKYDLISALCLDV